MKHLNHSRLNFNYHGNNLLFDICKCLECWQFLDYCIGVAGHVNSTTHHASDYDYESRCSSNDIENLKLNKENLREIMKF